MPGFEIIGEEEKKEILDVLSRKVLFRYEFDDMRKGIYKVETFEKQFASYCGVKYALAVSSGTAALRVALAALGIGPGDEVITQGFTFVATWESILDAGAIPVFAEIDDTLCLDPGDIVSKITPQTKAIVPVHMCGAQARIDEIVEIANKHGLHLIEDTAQSCGGKYKGKALGSFGDLGTFSFDSVKTLTTGEGGMLITNDRDLYIKASEYHDHGHDHDSNVGRGLEKHNFIGSNYRMMELQGALGIAQLGKLDSVILKNQKENKARIKKALGKIEGISFRNILDIEGDSATFVTFSLPTAEAASAFYKTLSESGVGSAYWYDSTSNAWHYYEQWEHLLEGNTLAHNGYPFNSNDSSGRCAYSKTALPKTADIMSRVISIQININMENQIPGILDAIEKTKKEI